MQYNDGAVYGYNKTDRKLWKSFLLTLVTCGIYSIVETTQIADEVNLVASRYDGRKTMHFCLLVFIVAPVTMGVGALVWYHNLSSRIGNELRRRGIAYDFGAADYWLWCLLGSLLFGIGPLVYLHKLYTAMNLLNGDYNING